MLYYRVFKTLNTGMPINMPHAIYAVCHIICHMPIMVIKYVIRFFPGAYISENRFESNPENSPNAFKLYKPRDL